MVCPQHSAGLRVDRFEPAVHARRSKPDRGRERAAPHLLQVVLLRLQASRALPKFESYEDARPQPFMRSEPGIDTGQTGRTRFTTKPLFHL
jgi:hypothetical protein